MSRYYLLYALKRILQAFVVIFLAYVITFIIATIVPGDPISNRLLDPDQGLSQDEIDVLLAYYGLDQPLVLQLWQSFSRFLIGDFGYSLSTFQPVSELIVASLSSTLYLTGGALVVALVVAFAIALGTQLLPVKYGQGLVRSLPAFVLSVPGFVTGLAVVQIFSFQLGWFHVLDPNSPLATFFASVALGIPISAGIAEVLIVNLDHESRQEYTTVARSRGLRHSRIVATHLLKPSSLPVVTQIALAVGGLLGGALITERIFGRRGLGSVVERAVTGLDTPVVQAIVSLAAVVFVLLNLIADLVYPWIDPRLRIQNTSKKPITRKLQAA